MVHIWPIKTFEYHALIWFNLRFKISLVRNFWAISNIILRKMEYFGIFRVFLVLDQTIIKVIEMFSKNIRRIQFLNSVFYVMWYLIRYFFLFILPKMNIYCAQRTQYSYSTTNKIINLYIYQNQFLRW